MQTNGQSSEIKAARQFASNAAALVGRSHAFQQLPPDKRNAILRDLGALQKAFIPAHASDPYAFALDTPDDFRRRRSQLTSPDGGGQPVPAQAPSPGDQTPDPTPVGAGASGSRAAATDTIAKRAGALSDELDFSPLRRQSGPRNLRCHSGCHHPADGDLCRPGQCRSQGCRSVHVGKRNT